MRVAYWHIFTYVFIFLLLLTACGDSSSRPEQTDNTGPATLKLEDAEHPAAVDADADAPEKAVDGGARGVYTEPTGDSPPSNAPGSITATGISAAKGKAPRSKADSSRNPDSSSHAKRNARSGPKVRRWTGISMMNLKEAPKGFPPDVLTQVAHVYRASPGDRAGVKKGDMIITANGTRVTRFQDIGKLTRGKPPGFSFTLGLNRGGKELQRPVTIEKRPDDMRARLIDAFTNTPFIPFEVDGMNAASDGRKVSSRQHKGKVLILDFWATWCGPCRRVSPVLDKMQKALGPKGLVVIGISSEEETTIKKHLKRHPVSYQVARDPYGEVKRDYEIDKLPTMFIVDRKGIVREVDIGIGHLRGLEDRVHALL